MAARATRLFVAIGIVVVLAGGVAAFVIHRAAAAEDERVEALVQAAAAELARDPLDRSAALAWLARLRSEPEPSPAALRRMHARVLLALGRARDAWEVIGPSASSPRAPPEDVAVGAEIQFAIHAETGDPDTASQALAMSRQSFEERHAVEPAFRAWQLAFRSGDLAAFAEFAAVLRSEFAADVRGRIARDASPPLLLLLGLRLGVAIDLDRFARLADDAGASGPEAEVARAWRVAREAAESSEGERLVELSAEFGVLQPELELVLCYQHLEREEFGEAAELATDIVAAVPSSVDARHAALVAAHQRTGGEPGSYENELRWLLDNAPPVDARRAIWARMR